MLIAIANYDSKIGYVQGMNYFVATVLLKFRPEHDEKAFSFLITLFQKYKFA